MHSKGQMMTTDFLIALILVIFSIGILISVAELRTYEVKEDIAYNNLQETAETGTIMLSGGSLVGCVTDNGTANGTIIPFSYDFSKSSELTKANLGLYDVNVYLEIDGTPIIVEDISKSRNSLTIDLELIECADGLGILDIKTANTVDVILRVGR